MKTIYIAEVKNADTMTNSAQNVLNYINGKFYVVGYYEEGHGDHTIVDINDNVWAVHDDTKLVLPIDGELIRDTCDNCKHQTDSSLCGAGVVYDDYTDDTFGCNKFTSKM